MKLGDAIEQLMRVATLIPGGVESEVHILRRWSEEDSG
jgi:hypothetical protein